MFENSRREIIYFLHSCGKKNYTPKLIFKRWLYLCHGQYCFPNYISSNSIYISNAVSVSLGVHYFTSLEINWHKVTGVIALMLLKHKRCASPTEDTDDWTRFNQYFLQYKVDILLHVKYLKSPGENSAEKLKTSYLSKDIKSSTTHS